MATIGTFARTDNGFSGSVKTLTLNVKAVKFLPAEGENQNGGPDFRIFAGATEFGAAWKMLALATRATPASLPWQAGRSGVSCFDLFGAGLVET